MTDDNRIDLSGADVDTPRGDTAKGEVKRLRGVMMSQAKTIVQMSARAKFIGTRRGKLFLKLIFCSS